MSTTAQAKRRRREAKMDTRYSKQRTRTRVFKGYKQTKGKK